MCYNTEVWRCQQAGSIFWDLDSALCEVILNFA